MTTSDPLWSPLDLGAVRVPHRVLLAPMTRMRAEEPGGRPSALMREFYRQRASAGLIITEGTSIGPGGRGYARTPGITTAGQIDGWRRVVDVVHEAGGRIALQLMHAGRVSHPDLLGGDLPGSASALAFDDWVTVQRQDGRIDRVDCPIPRSLSAVEIADVVSEYHAAAMNARRAGFDAVELHAAHGYLLHQFLSGESNHRVDEYGGSRENRTRLALETLDAVVAVIGASRVGLRVSPIGRFCGLDDTGGMEDAEELIRSAATRGIAWLHVSEPDWNGGASIDDESRSRLRRAFSGPIIAAGGYDLAKAQRVIKGGFADAVAFGRAFAANPDLPARLASGGPLNEIDKARLYDGGADGYTDYPVTPGSTR